MAFSPRLVAPVGTEKWWNPPSKGGVNPCIIRPSTGMCMPNCVGYAWGRFMEIIGEARPGLSANSPINWQKDSTSYEQGMTPRLGAAILWSGHVAIVEQIKEDGSIVTSNSGFPSTWFWIETHYPPDYKCDSGGTFLGFIYNPGGGGGATKQDQFVSAALDAVGKPREWAVGKSGVNSKSGGWSSLALLAIIKQVSGLEGKIVPKSISIDMMISVGVKNHSGEFKKANFFNRRVTPEPGDLILMRYNKKSVYKNRSPYTADKIGIVTEYKDNKITIVMGDVDGAIKKQEISIDNVCISAVYRPDWSEIEEKITGSKAGTNTSITGPLYETKNGPEDASLRQVSFVDKQGKPSLSKTDVKLSVINYTSVLSAIAEAFGGAGQQDEATIDFSKLGNNLGKIVGEYLQSEGLLPHQIVGILANISKDSGYRTSYVDNKTTGVGICQWTGARRHAMIQACGKDWKTNLSAQLDYMWAELNGSHKSVLSSILATKDISQKSAELCTQYFCNYESITPAPTKVLERKQECDKIWKKIVTLPITSGVTVPNNGVIKTRSGKILTVGKEIAIPSNVKQSGVSPNFSNYTYLTSHGMWGTSGYQYRLSEYWLQDGQPSDRGIATLGGYYMLAVVTRIGTVGDILTCILEDGTSFNVLIGDSKGGDEFIGRYNRSEWGHYYGGDGKSDIIEWEKKGTPLRSEDYDTKIDLTGWEGKKVVKFINYGSYFD